MHSLAILMYPFRCGPTHVIEINIKKKIPFWFSARQREIRAIHFGFGRKVRWVSPTLVYKLAASKCTGWFGTGNAVGQDPVMASLCGRSCIRHTVFAITQPRKWPGRDVRHTYVAVLSGDLKT